MKKKRCLSVVIISLLLGISCFIMAGCANKDNEDKDDTKIEQNLDKKEDAEDFNIRAEIFPDAAKMKKQMRIKRLKKMRMKTKIQGKPEFIMLMT